MKKFNKFFSVVLCLAMVLSFALVANAEEATEKIVEIENGEYVISFGDLTFAAIKESYNYGYAPAGNVDNVTATDVVVITNTEDGKFTMTDAYGRLIYMKGSYNSFNVGQSATGHEWVLVETDGGVYLKNVEKGKYVAFSANYGTWGCYKSVSDSSVLTVTAINEHVHAYRKVVIEATCTMWGCDMYVCDECGDSYAENYVPAHHNYDEGVFYNGYCIEESYTTFTCTDCGDSYVVNAGMGCHEVSWSNAGFEATCTEDGMKAFWYCGFCQGYFADEAMTIATTWDELVIPATGHEIVASSEGFEATCTEEGLVAYWYCGCCNTYFADAELTTPMEDQTGLNLSIPATGHEIVASSEGFEATCTEDGMMAYWYCGNCNCYFADAELTTLLEDQTGANLLIPATGHEITASSEGFEATCTEEGMLAYWYCGCCNTYFADAELTTPMEDQTGANLLTPAAGHSYGEDGFCTVCGEKDPEFVDPTEPTEPDVTEPSNPEETKPVEPDEDDKDVDQTGDASILFVIFGMLSMGGASTLVLKKKYN